MKSLSKIMKKALALNDSEKIAEYLNKHDCIEELMYKLESECSMKNDYLQILIDLVPYKIKECHSDILDVFAACLISCENPENLKYLLFEIKRRSVPFDNLIELMIKCYNDGGEVSYLTILYLKTLFEYI